MSASAVTALRLPPLSPQIQLPLSEVTSSWWPRPREIQSASTLESTLSTLCLRTDSHDQLSSDTLEGEETMFVHDNRTQRPRNILFALGLCLFMSVAAA